MRVARANQFIAANLILLFPMSAARSILPRLRLITYSKAGQSGVGVLLPQHGPNRQDAVVDLSNPLGVPDMRSFLQRGEEGMLRASEILKTATPFEASKVTIKAPINNPEKIICIGLNYRDHAAETNMAIPPEPVVFNKFPNALIGTGETIVKPAQTKELDWEVELVVVIGKQCRRVSKEEARQYVAGYTVGHDVSARDWQLRKPGGQWMLGKTWDTFAPIGPAIVTQVSDPHNLGLRCIVNGKTMQNGNTKNFIFDTDYIVSYLSQAITLQPGDLIFTGTPAGVGTGRKPPVYMKDGDVVECQVDEIGSITNTVRDEVQSKY